MLSDGEQTQVLIHGGRGRDHGRVHGGRGRDHGRVHGGRGRDHGRVHSGQVRGRERHTGQCRNFESPQRCATSASGVYNLGGGVRKSGVHILPLPWPRPPPPWTRSWPRSPAQRRKLSWPRLRPRPNKVVAEAASPTDEVVANAASTRTRPWPRLRPPRTRSWLRRRPPQTRSWPKSRTQQERSWPRRRPRRTRSCPKPLPEAMSTADEVVSEAASTADHVAAEVASSEDEVVAEAVDVARSSSSCRAFFARFFSRRTHVRSPRRRALCPSRIPARVRGEPPATCWAP